MAKYNLAQIQDLLRQSGWPENLIAKYAAIVVYESGGNTNAHNTNGENSYGLLQIYLRYHPDFDVSRYQDPIYNLTYAYGIYRREGDHAWITSVGKYNRDYQGTATQSRAIYANGISGGNDGTYAQTNYSVPSDTPGSGDNSLTSTGASDSTGLLLVAGVGLLTLFLFQRNYY